MKLARRTHRAKQAERRSSVGIAPKYVLHPLDPWVMCGPDTTVTELWKVREGRAKEARFHLVYFDRYGWYCEHGRGCKAVAEVRRAVRAMSANAARPKTKRSGKAATRKRR